MLFSYERDYGYEDIEIFEEEIMEIIEEIIFEEDK